jgi:DNA primase
MAVTDDIKQRLDLVTLVTESGVQLRKAGRGFTGFCPFHTNTRTPAFYVFPDTQSYYCFSCHAAGDAFTYVMARQGLEFGDALQQLAARAGVQLQARTPEQQQEDATRAKLRQINEDAAIYWHHLLRSTAKGQIGRDYVARRDLNDATIETWQLGYAPDDWSDLLRYLTDRKNHQPDEIERAGLVIKRDNGGYYDRFRNRLMFPIRNTKGEIVGFGGRALGDDHAKYMNTPETPLFHKGSVLYGIDQALATIRREDAVVLVEGYVDVLTAHQAGYGNVVAPMGTALTAEQIGGLKNLTKRIYLALDADAAGSNATDRSLELLQGDRDLSVSQIRIIRMPPGRDPDDVIRSDPATWRALVDDALPVLEYYFQRSVEGLDLRRLEDRNTAVRQLAPHVGNVLDPVERALYAQRLAEVVNLPPHVIQTAVERARRGKPIALPHAANDTGGTSTSFSREDHLLSLLLRFPDVQLAVESVLHQGLAQFPEIGGDIRGSLEEALSRTEHQQLWQHWQRTAPNTRLEHLDPYLREQAQRLLSYQDVPTLPVVNPQAQAAERAKKIAQELRKHVVIQRKNQLKVMYESVEDEDDRHALERRLNELNKYQHQVTAPRPSKTYLDLRTHQEQHG